MVCRNSRLSSAYTTFARDMSGLTDNQCLGLMHALMQEGAHADTPTREQWNALIDASIAEYRAGTLRINPGSHNPIARLEAGREEDPDGSRYYAITRVVERSRIAAAAQISYFQDYARQLGVPASHVSAEFWSNFDDATHNGRLQPTPAFVRAFEANPDHSGLMVDRRSLYAYEQMEIGRANRSLAQESRPAVTREPVESSAISEMGYNPDTGRLEIVMRANPSRVYAYRVDAETYQELTEARSAGSFFARRIRGNPDYQYGSAQEQTEAAVQRRCRTCGQWEGAAHRCPLTGSEEDLNRDIRMAVERARANAAGAAPAVTALPEPARLTAVRTQRYIHDDAVSGITRIPTANRIRQEARRSAQVLVPVNASFVATDDGYGGTVSGNVLVEYNGRGQGYAADAVTAPGDSGTDNLRCTCAQYRANYSCEHTRAVVSRVYSAVNETESQVAARPAVAAAAARATETLTPQYEASVAATEAQATEWRPVTTSFEADPAQFQELYAEARAARAAYKDAIAEGRTDVPYPIPYIEGEAFGGLASRASGRGFGIEVEFGFPDTMSYQEVSAARAQIARELYALGLTHNRRQLGYGASHGTVRTEHARGWSYESDPTVNGGEIVSPVMYDEAETWTNISKVAEVLERNGAIATTNAGMHVHVGTGDYDHRVENHNRLLAVVAENEDLLYRMSSNPDRGRHRGQGHCAPNAAPSSPYTDLGRARSANYGHHLAVNLQSVGGQPGDHVEFRTFDSTLKPAAMQAHIGMAVYMAAAGSRPGTADIRNPERHPLGERLAENPSRGTLTGAAWHASTQGMRRFIDRCVPGTGGDDKDNPRVRQMVSLFAMTKWQRRGRDW